jgi:hypothetical protein
VAEVEIHTGHPHEGDELGKKVGVMVGVIGIVLAVVTIASHREHTAAVVFKTEANDQWAYYQAKKIREYTSDVALTLIQTLGADPVKSEASSKKLEAARAKYVSDAEKIQQDAKAKDDESDHEEARALRFDIGEGLLELGLVLCSLYFLARKSFFPVFGVLAAVAGAAMGLWGYLL